MARPKADYPPAESIRALMGADGRLMVRVTPGARHEALEISDGVLTVKVRAKPQDGAANEAVIRHVAKALGEAPSKLTIVRGETSREKLLQLP